MYALGKTDPVVGDSNNLQARNGALEGPVTMAQNDWRVAVEPHSSGKRVDESPRQAAREASAPEATR